MKHASDPTGKGISFYSQVWRLSLVAGLCVCALVVGFSAGSVFSPSAYAASVSPSARTFSVSPTQGPVGAVIVVRSSEAFVSDGTKINLGYVSADGSTCNVVSGGQAGVVHDHAFSGWFRWPASTGKGSFGVCIDVDGNPYRIGTYTVLSATPARVTVSPTTPNAGKQATVSGASFLPAGTKVSLFWNSAQGGQGISLGTVSSGSSGTFTHTFTVPSRASTGSYIVTATVGSGQPPTLSATTTFRVNGITIVAMPTPTAMPSPTVAPTATPTTSATASATKTKQTGSSGGKNSGKSGLILPIALGGSLLIALALVAGVLVVRKQRAPLPAVSDEFSWHGAPDPALLAGGGYAPGPGAALYQMSGAPPPTRSGMGYAQSAPGPEAQPTLIMGQNGGAAIPFDPGLAEAMREAQVSLFATPRPPVGEEVPS